MLSTRGPSPPVLFDSDSVFRAPRTGAEAASALQHRQEDTSQHSTREYDGPAVPPYQRFW